MKEYTYTIKDPVGIHARPAGKVVAVAKRQEAFLTLWKGEESYDLKKLLSIVGCGLQYGDTFVIRAEGPDEERALKTVVKAFEDNGL